MKYLWQIAAGKCRTQDKGFTLVIAVAMGSVILIIATTLIFRASRHEAIASARTETGDSLAVAEAGIARTLILFAKSENAALLTRSYDPINPRTNKNYLGIDGIPNTGDETTTAVNQWTTPITSPCPHAIPSPAASTLSYNGTIGVNGQYSLLAYRYDQLKQVGIFLVEGQKTIAGQPISSSYISITVAIDSKLTDFPGVVQALETISGSDTSINLSGRGLRGSNGNIYFDPLVSRSNNPNHTSPPNPLSDGFAAPTDANRNVYLSEIDFTSHDVGFTDNVGKIIACTLTPSLSNQLPIGAVVKQDLDNLTDNPSPSISGSSGGISYYTANWIWLHDKTVNVDTTNGPVYLYVDSFIYMTGNAKIRNYRSDSQPARVGDLRIIISANNPPGAPIWLKDRSCIENAFVYNITGDVVLETSASGCNSANSSIDGVVWAEDISNNASSRSGIAVPDDVSSVSDLIFYLNLPTVNKIESVIGWQKHQL